MGLSFRTFKDAVWKPLDTLLMRLVRASRPVQNIGFGVLHGLLLLPYYLPRTPLRRTTTAFTSVIGEASPRKFYSAFVGQVVLGFRGMEDLRSGRTEEIDGLLKIPDEARLQAILSAGNGALMVMPHCHASVLAVRGLAARYPTLMMVSPTANEARAQAQLSYYKNLGCGFLDVRRSNEGTVARSILTALRQGKIVVGIVDRIHKAPKSTNPYNKTKDRVRTQAFGQPVGAPGWPARFSAKCNAPILPVMVEQSKNALTLHLGQAIFADDTVGATQAWMTVVEDLIRRYPSDWLFVYDKHWAEILGRSAQQLEAQP